jgi:uncharacterized repeat protein (TIGR03803 family)
LALAVVVDSVLAGRVMAQAFTTLHSFTATSTDSSGVNTNSDGVGASSLVLSGNILYGTARGGGSGGNGTVFKVNTEGAGFSTLHNFASASTNSLGSWTNRDGASPSGLITSGNIIYGTTSVGGTSGNGTVFAINTDGTGFTNLYNFTATRTNSSNIYTNGDGAKPWGTLILSVNTLYGTAYGGSTFGGGTVFAVSTNGTDFSILHAFAGGGELPPTGGLILSNSTLYGTAGSTYANGGVFKVNTDGTGFTNLYTFTALINPFDCGEGTNTDGSFPTSVILSGNTLFGTTFAGGQNGGGTVFKVNTNGTGFRNLYNFTADSNGFGPGPCGGYAGGLSAGLVLWGNSLFGTTPGFILDGVYDPFSGTVFALNIDGTGFTTLHTFSPSEGGGPNFDGAEPDSRLILSGNTLYGTTGYGGSSGNGTIFSISFQPQLKIIPSRANVILTWPTNRFDHAEYRLQSTTNLALPLWATNLPAPVVVNGLNTVTNPISGKQRFFRLVH